MVAWRAVDVDAPAALVFRWVCQLRAAPYSYDLIDNFGRRSPRRLVPGLGTLEVGQRFMTIFVLASFEDRSSVTIETGGRFVGHVACTYRVAARGPETSRLVVKLLAAAPGGPFHALTRNVLRALLPVGDLVMMRKQLLNLKALAERDATSAEVAGAV